jgi:beta-phosphoglucomutase-like phosphatase (HAD superfamily)
MWQYFTLHAFLCISLLYKHVDALKPSSYFKAKSSAVKPLNAKPKYALLFDCDGVIVETEELHRKAYNMAFKKFGLTLPDGSPVEWKTEYYDVLQNTVGGGKAKMKYYFNNDAKAWPVSKVPYRKAPLTDEAKSKLVDELQDAKTEFYKEIVDQVAIARPGVLELMDEAIACPDIFVGICSAATKGGFEKIVNSVVGRERLSKLDIIIAGDDVTEKKPHPMIYNIASERLGVDPSNCIVVEDSIVGLKAAKGANMHCVITYTSSTANEDFKSYGASAAIESLDGITLERFFTPEDGDKMSILTSFVSQEKGSIMPAAISKEVCIIGWTPHATIMK